MRGHIGIFKVFWAKRTLWPYLYHHCLHFFLIYTFTHTFNKICWSAIFCGILAPCEVLGLLKMKTSSCDRDWSEHNQQSAWRNLLNAESNQNKSLWKEHEKDENHFSEQGGISGVPKYRQMPVHVSALSTRSCFRFLNGCIVCCVGHHTKQWIFILSLTFCLFLYLGGYRGDVKATSF